MRYEHGNWWHESLACHADRQHPDGIADAGSVAIHRCRNVSYFRDRAGAFAFRLFASGIAMMPLTEKFNGIPALGLGTAFRKGPEGLAGIEMDLDAGYSHLDTGTESKTENESGASC